jgi:class I fructose-bisphosphate aldolase
MKHIEIDVESNVKVRPTIDLVNSNEEIQERLYEMFYEYGPGHGTFLSLPFDQIVEHGPSYQLGWRFKKDSNEVENILRRGYGCGDPRTVLKLAKKGNYSALVLHPGIARKYWEQMIGEISNDDEFDVPLIYKIDGHVLVPANPSIPSVIGSLDDAAELGATAIGMSFYMGSEETERDMERIAKLIEEAHEYGLPAVVWAYPRGPGINDMGADSLFWVHYAVAVAESLGADIIKTKFPKPVTDEKKRELYFNYIDKLRSKKKIEAIEQYKKLEPELGEKIAPELHTYRVKIVLDAASRTFVVFSGGPKKEGDPKTKLVEETKIIMDAGGEGRIIGRNFWGVPLEEGLELTRTVAEVMTQPQYRRPDPYGYE